MKRPQGGNGSSKFEVGAHDMGGWVRVVASFAPPPPDDLGFYLAHRLSHWFREHPQFRLISVVPINKDGATVEPADVVVLRRVVCCTPDGPALLGAAAAKARRTLLASYPRDRLLTRAFSWLENLGFRLVGKRFRSYVHPPAELEEAAAGRGLTRSRVSRGLVWETAQYDAPSA